MPKDKTCCSLLTTFSDSHKLTLWCLLCLDVSPLTFVTNQPWLPILEVLKSMTTANVTNQPWLPILEVLKSMTTAKKGSITSVQAIYVPADDFTDPAPATTFAHLDATNVLSRQISEILLTLHPACFHLTFWERNTTTLLVVYKSSPDLQESSRYHCHFGL